jgi:parallel beta-helix repeat protein
MRLFLTISLACASAFAAGNPEENLRALLQAKTGAIHLPVGTIEITREIVLPTGAHDLEILGAGTVLKASAAFRGRALLVIPGGTNIKISGLSIDGARDTTGRMTLVPPEGRLISRVVANNGALIEGVTGLDLADIKAVHVAGFALVIGSSRNIRLHDIEVSESGGFDPQLRNNGAGGIALEDGVANFELTRCRFGGIRGNGVTIRSAGHGRIAENEFAVMARDAIEVHQANALVIENNRARQIGAPTEEVAGRAECMRLENLSDSVVNGNTCEETLLGAIVLSGSRNTITGNRLLHLNLAQKIEPGIYLAGPASGNTVEGNVIGGSGMSSHCVEMAPALPKDANRSIKNDCSDEASVAGLRDLPGALYLAALVTAACCKYTRESEHGRTRHAKDNTGSGTDQTVGNMRTHVHEGRSDHLERNSRPPLDVLVN